MSEKITVEKIGTKSIKIKTFGNEKTRISGLLSVNSGGLKLPPLIVFKGKKVLIYERLQTRICY